MSQLPATSLIDSAVRPATPSRFSELATEDFIKIIFTELSNQDPFQPNDSAALLDQLNSIRSIESDIELTRRLESLVFENQLAAASNMLGSYVSGLTADNDQVAGLAVGVVREGDNVLVQLDNGFRIPISNVREILGLLPGPASGSASRSPTTPAAS